MNFITGFIMSVVIFIVVAYAIIFNAAGCQLDELCERINDLEEEIYNDDKDLEEGDD